MEKQNFKRSVINASLLILLVIFYVCYSVFMFYKTNEQYDIRLKETGDEVAKNINSQMNLAVMYVEGLAEGFSNYEDIHCDEAVETLIRVSEKSHFKRMWLTKIDGRAISSELKDSDATGRGYLKRALNGESGISEVQHSRVNNEKNVVIFAPTYYNGEVTGMVIGIFRLDNLLDVIDVQCFGGNGYCKIYDTKGDVLVSSDELTMETELQNKYGYSSPIGILDWNVYVSFPEEVIDGDIRNNIIITVVMCVICVLVLGTIVISAFWERNKILAERAKMDSLTSLMNRGAIEDIVDMKLDKNGASEKAFVVFDIDKFKSVNDSIGHVSGDALLKEVAGLMRNYFIDVDCLSRLGGDEFAIFINEVKDKKRLLRDIEKFRRMVSEVRIDSKRCSTISIGIVFTQDKEDSFDSLYKKADQAMYESKRQGGNKVTIYKEDHK